MVDKRKNIELLPGYLQTETLKKVFSATVDHLFQPESVEFLSGYIGNKPSWYDSSKDFYIPESNSARTNYQLSPTIVSRDFLSGQITNAMFYEDLLGQLRFHGGLVNNPDRLFEQEYYSWAPPIDIDKFTNFSNYVWIQNGPSVIYLTGSTDLVSDALDNASFTYSGYVQYQSTSETARIDLKFTNGLIVVPMQDATLSYNGIPFVIEGVGSSIRLVRFASFDSPAWDIQGWSVAGFDTDSQTIDKEYFTIKRSSLDGNQWSKTNRWFHRDIISISKTVLPDYFSGQALRPIIEFNADIELYKYGTNDRGTVDLVSYANSNFIGSVVGRGSASIDDINLTDGMRILVIGDSHSDVNNKIFIINNPILPPDVKIFPPNILETSSYSTLPYDNTGGANIQVLVDGIKQVRGVDYSWLGSVITLHTPAPIGSVVSIEVFSQGRITVSLDTNGSINGDGNPIFGDRVDVRFGHFANPEPQNLYFNGHTWVNTGQQRFGTAAPLFNLYDLDGISMDDNGVYPNSSFTGSTVFSYSIDTSNAIDSELGLNPKLDQFGDYVFTNNLATDVVTYTNGNTTATYVGDLWCRIANYYTNSWNRAENSSRQYIRNEFVADNSQTIFVFDQEPATQVDNTIPTIFVYIIGSDFVQTLLANDIDYTVNGRSIILKTPLMAGTRVIILTWNFTAPTILTGSYDVPLNLSANPNNLPLTTASRSQFLPHFVSIMENQTGFIGQALGINNYRDTAQVHSLGTGILQHRAPLLKLGMLNSVPFSDLNSTLSVSDPMMAMQFAQRSYQRFYNRFLQALFNLSTSLGYSGTSQISGCDPYMAEQWVQSALKQINVGKTSASAWANSGPSRLPGTYCSIQSTNPTYVPASPTRLGLTPAFYPEVYIDSTYTTPALAIQCHDGSRIVMVDSEGVSLGSILHNQQLTSNPDQLTNPVAAAWLQFELDLYNNLPQSYKNTDTTLAFDAVSYLPGKWRNSSYTRDEQLAVQRSMFDKWVVSAQVDYTANTGYDTTNQFSYNYSVCIDKQGQSVPGHWQGIYRWFYDTDRPHTHPWEMLGFSQKPNWWDSQYGEAPYTNGNTAMWEDLRDGRIRQGNRVGIDITRARPGLLDCIPVDNQGKLLPPYQAGCVISLPSVYDSSSPWKFGDEGPIESTWRLSQDYTFALSQTAYLMKPARFFEQTWDSLRTMQIYSNTENSQWVYIDTNRRRSSTEFYVHRENPSVINNGITIPNESNLSYFGSCGLQHWISEYVISQGLDITKYVGSVIRGANVQLAHRMAGYINADSIRTLVDSFGQIGYNSQLIPGENVNTYLYRSTSIGENFYGGVLIEQVKTGWKISGYDSLNPIFTIIPSNIYGSKNNVVIGNQKVVEYTSGLNYTSTVPYNTIFSNRQDVYDFIISYGRWLINQGWVFDQFSTVGNVVNDWYQSAKEFLFWSQGSWSNGMFITLSPSAELVKFTQQYGNIQYINGIVGGSYPIIDRAGAPIQPQNVNILRDESSITINATNSQGIFGLRLFRTTIEHAVFWDNVTQFSDVIYDPLYNLKQDRIKILCYRTTDWNGRVDAPGYIITKSSTGNTWTMTSNFEKTAEDFNKYFNFSEPKTYTVYEPSTGLQVTKSTVENAVDRKDLADLAKHTIGYQKRDYLQNLLLEDSTEFEFYQGFIKQKGTRSTIDKLLRNTSLIPAGSTFEYYEEWLLRLGTYGATSLNSLIEFKLPASKIVSNPQWIRFFGPSLFDQLNDTVYDIVQRDPNIVVPPESYSTNMFSLRNSYSANHTTDLPSAGYAQLGEVTWLAATTADLLSLYTTQSSTSLPMKPRDTVWQFITDTAGWMVWSLVPSLSQISTTAPSQSTGLPTTIFTTSPHGLLNGDICVIFGVTGVSLINGTYPISAVTPTSFQITLSTFEAGTGGTIWVYRPVRFPDIFTRDTSELPGGWMTGDLAYVDEGGIEPNAWAVYQYIKSKWIPYRKQEFRIDPYMLISSQIYNSSNGTQISRFNYHDPAAGRIAGRADAEIDYKTDYDPARYNKGNQTVTALSPTEAWRDEQVGNVWWDLSTVRYIDYAQGNDTYRYQHWGKVAPGTGITVYEWIRSPIPPTDWASYVAQGTSITEDGRSYIPSGFVKNPTNPSWTEVVEYNSDGTSSNWYYFWVGNSGMSPPVSWRQLTTGHIAALISDPSQDDQPWYAAISQHSIIVGNVQNLLDGNKMVQKLTYTDVKNDNNKYSEWELVREGDAMSPINSIMWDKMKSSLTTIDGIGNDVPDYHLNDLEKYGTTIRPRQSWFVDRIAASKVFVDAFNLQLANSLTPLVDDSSKSNWTIYFNLSEPIPTQAGNWDYQVTDMSARDALIGIITPGQIVLVDPVSINNNLWTLWEYQSRSSWQLVRQQSYNTSNYWQYVDWYMAGYSASTQLNNTVETIADLSTISDPTSGYVVKVINNGTNKWQLYAWNTVWILVGQQDGNIEVLPSVYTWSLTFGGFDGSLFDSSAFDQTSAIEFGNIIDGIKSAIYSTSNSIELNTLFFAMINYVIAEQGQVDWVLKTSNILLKGFNQPLLQSAILSVDNTDSLLGFVNEVKPYHSKIREFIPGVSAIDLADINIKEISRSLKTTLLFDRIWSPDLGDAHATTGAMDRILSYYNPLPGMLPLDLNNLISGASYKGTILTGLGFNVQEGWGAGPWGSVLSWDADAATIESALDQIIEAGVAPHYDSAVGNGISKKFSLTKNVMSPLNLVVWSDGRLRTYGVDYTVPTYATNVEVIAGGTGYQVGDQVDINAGISIAPTRLLVTSVNNGSITSMKIEGAGLYSIVNSGPYTVSYPLSYPGTGTNATVNIDWSVADIEFLIPPLSSNRANIFVLYVGTTFEPAPNHPDDTAYDGVDFVQPNIDNNHPEEYYPARVKDSILMTVSSRAVGGRPLVSNKIYITDGITDQFDLMVMPQSDSAIIAYLNGTLLKPGLSRDFVINYENGRMVFLSTPPVGLLQVTVIGVGGSSRIPLTATVVESDIGVNPGDIIVLQPEVALSPTNVILNTVKAVECIIIAGSYGYSVGDILKVSKSNGVMHLNLETTLTVTSVGINGTITGVEISTPGSWSTLPSTIEWISNHSQKPIININWGSDTGTIQSTGLYSRIPDLPIITDTITGSGWGLSWDTIEWQFNTSGRWDIEFGGTSAQYVFEGDGTTTDFFVDNAGGYLVNVAGKLSSYSLITYPQNGIRLPIAPSYGSTIVVTLFDSSSFSSIIETDINVVDHNNLIYQLNSSPTSSQPIYDTTRVLKNGNLVQPARLYQTHGDGFSRRFSCLINTSNAIITSLYIDDVFINPTYYSITGGVLTISSTWPVPRLGADITVVIIATDTVYTLNGSQIVFQAGSLTNGDKIRVTTYSEDIDYEFHTEEFVTTNLNTFNLAKTVDDYNTISVWYDGVVQMFGRDYIIKNVDEQSGWSTYGWDLSLFDTTLPATTAILMNQVTPGHQLTVNYMSGRAHRPAIEWKTVTTTDSVLSAVVDKAHQTTILGNVYIDSTQIEIADFTCISPSVVGSPGAVFINDELITFGSILQSPTVTHPARAFLTNINRNRLGTSGNPRSIYDALYYDGNGSETLFATASFDRPPTVVIVDGRMLDNDVNDTLHSQTNIKEWEYVINPDGKPSGQYIKILTNLPPRVGYRNVCIISLTQDDVNGVLCHIAGSQVIDAGQNTRIPGDYRWEPSSTGLQYSNTPQGIFMLAHSIGA